MIIRHNTICCSRAVLGAFPSRSLEVEEVIEKNHVAPAESQFAFAQEQPVAAKPSAISDNHAFRTA